MANNKVAFVCDSAAVLPLGKEEKIGATVIPLTIISPSGQVYEDSPAGMTIEKLAGDIDKGIKHKTSVAPIGKVVEVIENLSKEYDQVIFFPLAKALSSQFSQLRPLEQEYRKLQVIDTNDACLSLGFLMLDAREILANGGTFEDIQKYAYDRDKRRTTCFIPGDTKGLVASGRMPRLAGMVANKVNLKPIVKFKAEIDLGGIALGKKAAIKRLVKGMKKEYKLTDGTNIRRIFVYAGLASQDTLDLMHRTLFEELGLPIGSVKEAPVPAVVMAHTMRDTVGVFLEVKEAKDK